MEKNFKNLLDDCFKKVHYSKECEYIAKEPTEYKNGLIKLSKEILAAVDDKSNYKRAVEIGDTISPSKDFNVNLINNDQRGYLYIGKLLVSENTISFEDGKLKWNIRFWINNVINHHFYQNIQNIKVTLIGRELSKNKLIKIYEGKTSKSVKEWLREVHSKIGWFFKSESYTYWKLSNLIYLLSKDYEIHVYAKPQDIDESKKKLSKTKNNKTKNNDCKNKFKNKKEILKKIDLEITNTLSENDINNFVEAGILKLVDRNQMIFESCNGDQYWEKITKFHHLENKPNYFSNIKKLKQYPLVSEFNKNILKDFRQKILSFKIKNFEVKLNKKDNSYSLTNNFSFKEFYDKELWMKSNALYMITTIDNDGNERIYKFGTTENSLCDRIYQYFSASLVKKPNGQITNWRTRNNFICLSDCIFNIYCWSPTINFKNLDSQKLGNLYLTPNYQKAVIEEAEKKLIEEYQKLNPLKDKNNEGLRPIGNNNKK